MGEKPTIFVQNTLVIIAVKCYFFSVLVGVGFRFILMGRIDGQKVGRCQGDLAFN